MVAASKTPDPELLLTHWPSGVAFTLPVEHVAAVIDMFFGASVMLEVGPAAQAAGIPFGAVDVSETAEQIENQLIDLGGKEVDAPP